MSKGTNVLVGVVVGVVIGGVVGTAAGLLRNEGMDSISTVLIAITGALGGAAASALARRRSSAGRD